KRQIVFFTALFLIILSFLLTIFKDRIGIVGIIVVYLPYLLIYPMALLTLPLENYIKKSYENEARKILSGMDHMIKIGITGSFGKTTTKNIVKDIIGESYYTLMTPASYNTPMGITRTIREYMKPIHEVFVCEMGADHVGEITYLMDFVKPKYGILTAIGPQHLNTFHSIDNIIHEKFEIIEKLPADGVGILNIDNDYIRDYTVKNTCKIVTVGIRHEEADLVAKDIVYSREGSSFTVTINGEDVRFDTVLLGEHNIMNLLTAIALALELGIDPQTLQKSVANVKRVEHRLELKKINGFTFIDNAFNSNPVGCKLSLDVLKGMGGKRVIVTPGLIDLGDKEDMYNREFGAYMKDRADEAVLVGEKQTAAIVEGLRLSGFDEEHIHVVKTVKEAFAYVYSHCTTEDTILLENDLPDAFSV
ncbi:MAG: UDP-N-acetylmuramoyl-tripeptide--D-alanyl-D-alanine ligase, partial [Erysipelotrichaceae bacterium]|nr:UDP-N-acetylmuramoyl-tripeptide--D-alanyl-D-alanine ligase [Erysipelotrichaceae bacterium]